VRESAWRARPAAEQATSPWASTFHRGRGRATSWRSWMRGRGRRLLEEHVAGGYKALPRRRTRPTATTYASRARVPVAKDQTPPADGLVLGPSATYRAVGDL
jgi:hypothetical protein